MANPLNQETRLDYNREPGIVIVEGSPYAREMEKFEQFPSKYGQNPGNPYVYRPFPKMLYRAARYEGNVVCMAAPPDPAFFKDGRDYERAEAAARKFTESCQRIVNDEVEYSRAREMGWCDSPSEAVEFVHGRDRADSTAQAERNYQDRNMSDAAKAEARAALERNDGRHLPSVPEARLAKKPRGFAALTPEQRKAAVEKGRQTRAAKKDHSPAA